MEVKENIRKKLIISANAYSVLLNKKILININELNKRYCIRFYKTNFLHLTGVRSSLNSINFYFKCLKGTITTNDFGFNNDPVVKAHAIQKMKNLINIDNFFDNELLVQIRFHKGLINSLFATCNNVFTIGFANAKYVCVPMTLLDKNRLNKRKKIYKVKPIIDNVY